MSDIIPPECSLDFITVYINKKRKKTAVRPDNDLYDRIQVIEAIKALGTPNRRELLRLLRHLRKRRIDDILCILKEEGVIEITRAPGADGAESIFYSVIK